NLKLSQHGFNENDDSIKMNKEKIDNMPMTYGDEVIENGIMINSDSLEKDLKKD
ncbi:7423_t:CDS:2, partial [Racocetra persica]